MPVSIVRCNGSYVKSFRNALRIAPRAVASNLRVDWAISAKPDGIRREYLL
jgi:hypothetical protein